MNENEYIILSDDTFESEYQSDISKDDEKIIDTFIEKILKNM